MCTCLCTHALRSSAIAPRYNVPNIWPTLDNPDTCYGVLIGFRDGKFLHEVERYAILGQHWCPVYQAPSTGIRWYPQFGWTNLIWVGHLSICHTSLIVDVHDATTDSH